MSHFISFKESRNAFSFLIKSDISLFNSLLVTLLPNLGNFYISDKPFLSTIDFKSGRGPSLNINDKHLNIVCYQVQFLVDSDSVYDFGVLEE